VDDGDVLGDVHGKSGFAHRGTRRDDDQVRRLQAAGHSVEFFVVRLQPGDALAVLVEIVEREAALFDDVFDPHEAAADAVLGNLVDRRFSSVDDLFGRVCLLKGACNGGVSGVDQAPQQRLVFDDLYVVLNVVAARQALREGRKICD